MPSALPDKKYRSKHKPTLLSLQKLFEFWHHGAAWIVGPLLIGLIAVLLAVGSEKATSVYAAFFHRYIWAPIIIMPAGFALVVYLTRRYFPGTQGSGIPQTIAELDRMSAAKTSNLLSIRIMLGKVLLTLGGLAFGAPIGREGPTVQLGASIMHAFYGRRPFRNATHRRALILAGGAAGIAAAFNTPLAGIMFAIEELSKKHVFNANSSTLMTVIVSGLISIALLGNYTYFGSTGAYLNLNQNVIALFLCGVIGGAAGGIFSRLLLAATFNLPVRIATYIAEHPFRFAAMCGFAVALLGIATNGIILGTGYQPTRASLENSGVLPWHFGIAKMLATLLAAVSGIPGGIFAPSLAAGAGIGDNIAAILPGLAPHSAIVLLTMAAYLSGVTRAPVTSFVITMEMTDSHQMLLSLMITALVASSISKFICPTPLYHALADRFSSKPQEDVSHQPLSDEATSLPMHEKTDAGQSTGTEKQ